MAGASPATTMIRLDRPMHPSHGSGTPLRVPCLISPYLSVANKVKKGKVFQITLEKPCKNNLFTRLYSHQVSIKGAAAVEICQPVRGRPVDIALIRTELRPPDSGCRKHARTHLLRYFRHQAAPTALVAHAHQLPAANTARQSITGVDTQRRRSLLRAQAILVTERRADEVMSSRTEERKASCSRCRGTLPGTRLHFGFPARDGIIPPRCGMSRIKLYFA